MLLIISVTVVQGIDRLGTGISCSTSLSHIIEVHESHETSEMRVLSYKNNTFAAACYDVQA